MTNTEQPARERRRPSHRTIGLRLYEDEIAALDRAVSGSGARSRNHLMRRLARRAGGLMDPDPAVIAAWGELVVVMRRAFGQPQRTLIAAHRSAKAGRIRSELFAALEAAADAQGTDDQSTDGQGAEDQESADA